MSAAYWREISHKAIKQAMAEVPADADEKTKRKAISAKYPFGERKWYPYKIWLEEVRKFFTPTDQPVLSRSDIHRIQEYEKATGKKFPGGAV